MQGFFFAIFTSFKLLKHTIFLKYLKGFFWLGLAWFLLHLVLICIDGLTDEERPADVAVVLGTTVNEDGSLSERLEARLDRAVQLFEDSLVTRLFVSGGLGKEGHYEGDKMAEYLVQQGTPTEAIVIDNGGNTTGLTAQNLASTLPDVSSAIVVTQYFHISRSKLALSHLGIADVSGAHAHYFEIRDAYSLFREFFGYYKYLLF